MPEQSLLTQGLESLSSTKSKAIHSNINELYALDIALQKAHDEAKYNDELGEKVVSKYKAFLSCRQQLIAELEKKNIQVPWQLRMTIDDLELTLTQREEQKKDNLSKTNTSRIKKIEEPVQMVQPGRATVAFIGPTLVALFIAMLWYHYNN
ncbi:unnamed protein product [Peronospora belbahrii]|uniref:Uncharacterized protein n=1 Tax=Peronospora belbahrii TaxID=622444 RepID=A0ABN8CLK6_9STRA|nr:unnamed protein product [Peronospora belbahrii]